jgi:hypothetical protein
MKQEQAPQDVDTKSVSRRELVRKLAKLAYVIPAILAVVKTAERPAFAGVSDM